MCAVLSAIGFFLLILAAVALGIAAVATMLNGFDLADPDDDDDYDDDEWPASNMHGL